MITQLSLRKLYHSLFMILTRAVNSPLSLSLNHVEFVLTQEATDILRKIDGPIGLVAVAGMYRTGKSYLLNRMLLNRSNGFGVGPTINPCTKVSSLLFKRANRVFGCGASQFQEPLQTESQSMF